jgi:hypothetical protein
VREKGRRVGALYRLKAKLEYRHTREAETLQEFDYFFGNDTEIFGDDG